MLRVFIAIVALGVALILLAPTPTFAAEPQVITNASGQVIGYVYTEPLTAAQVTAITGSEPAPIIYRWTENTVAPTAEEIASNPFLRDGIGGY